MSKNRSRKNLHQKLHELFLPLGRLVQASTAKVPKRSLPPMLDAVVRQFPEATEDDCYGMIREIMQAKDKGPSWRRMHEATLWAIVEQITTAVIDVGDETSTT